MSFVRTLLLILIVAGAFGCGHRWDDVKVKPVEEGQKEISFRDMKGKVLLLDFWATWCGPCRQLAPDIDALNEKYSKDGLVVLAITDETPEVVKSFSADQSHSFSYYTDEPKNAFRVFNVTGLPTVILIGKNGDQIARCDGYPLPADFEEKIQNALK